MRKIEEILKKMSKETKKMSFSESMRYAREIVGLKQYRTAEHIGIPHPRLKNLEVGYFREMPSATEIRDISNFFCLDHELMIKKADKHVRARDKYVKSKLKA